MNSTPIANAACPHRVAFASAGADAPARSDGEGEAPDHGAAPLADAGLSDWPAQMRGLPPVAYSPAHDAWLVSGYSEVLTVLKNPRVFSSLHNMEPAAPWPPEVRQVLEEGYPLAPALQNNDPPFHTHVRMLYSDTFAPVRLARLTASLGALCHELIDQFADDGQADLRARLALPLALTTVTDLLGVPRAEAAQVGRWYDAWACMYAWGATLEQQLEGARSLLALQRYYAALLDQRRGNPRDDLATTLVQTRLDGIRPLSRAEMTTHMILLCNGSHAMCNLICNALLLLARRPAPWPAGQLGALIEEVLRLDAPVQVSRRRVTQPFELGGALLPRGASVYVLLGAANRDAAVFERADQLDLARGECRHMAFGWGAHFCVGASLSRTVAQIALEAAGRRLPGLRVRPGWSPDYMPTPFVRALTALPLAWDTYTHAM